MVKRQFRKKFIEDALYYVHDHSDLSVNACAKNFGISIHTLHGMGKLG